MTAYPIVLEGSAISALVVGGGAVATRKVRALLAAGAKVRVVSPELSPDLVALAGDGTRSTLELIRGRYVPDHVAGVTLVVAATNDPAVNAAVARDARNARTLVNVADAPELGDFVTPAVHRTGDVVVAVVAGGVPAAAARIRDAVADSIDDRYATAVAGLSTLRRTMLDRGDREGWQAASTALLDENFCDAVESGEFARRLDAWR